MPQWIKWYVTLTIMCKHGHNILHIIIMVIVVFQQHFCHSVLEQSALDTHSAAKDLKPKDIPSSSEPKISPSKLGSSKMLAVDDDSGRYSSSACLPVVPQVHPWHLVCTVCAHYLLCICFLLTLMLFSVESCLYHLLNWVLSICCLALFINHTTIHWLSPGQRMILIWAARPLEWFSVILCNHLYFLALLLLDSSLFSSVGFM